MILVYSLKHLTWVWRASSSNNTFFSYKTDGLYLALCYVTLLILHCIVSVRTELHKHVFILTTSRPENCALDCKNLSEPGDNKWSYRQTEWTDHSDQLIFLRPAIFYKDGSFRLPANFVFHSTTCPRNSPGGTTGRKKFSSPEKFPFPVCLTDSQQTRGDWE